MKVLPTTTNFCGYKNIISDEIISGNSELTFIAAQLNNEVHPDLTEFRKTKLLLEQPEHVVNNDVISIIYTHYNGNKPNLFIDDRVLFWGNELKWLQENRPKAMLLKEYQGIEAAHMKAYTLMAGLTRRMMNNNLNNNDSGIQNVIREFMRVLTGFTKDDNASFEVIQHSFSSNNDIGKTAEKFNQIFMKTMRAFFK